MGMFDYVRCEYPLPGLDDPTKIQFQTKDTDEQYMMHYRITKDGLLMRLVGHIEDHSDPNAKPGSWQSLCGCMTFVKDGEELEPYCGVLNFYGDKHTGELISLNLKTGKDELHPGPEPEWFEYNAQFEGGRLLGVERITE